MNSFFAACFSGRSLPAGTLLLLAGLAGAFLVSCKGEDDRAPQPARPGAAQEKAHETGPRTALPDVSAPETPRIRKESAVPPPVAEQNAVILAEEFLDFLESKFAKDTTFVSRYAEAFEAHIRDSKQFIALMREVYGPREYQPLFFDFEDRVPRLSTIGEQMRDLVLEFPSHGLSAKEYQVARLQELLPAFDAARKVYADARQDLSGEQARKLWEIAEDFESMPRDSEIRGLLAKEGFGDSDVKLVRELARFYPNLLAAKRDLNSRLQEIDTILLAAFYRFLLDFKYLYRAHPFSVTPEISLSHVKFREKLLEDFHRADPEFAAYLRDLIPANPTYERLRHGLLHYRKLADEGRVDKIRFKKALSRGAKGPEVKSLADRMAMEGFLAEQHVSERFGPELEAAVKAYQQTHQLQVTGKTDTATRASLNIPMARRVEQIALGLQRWRESDISRTAPAFYLRVNIPQFELEVWENNQLIRKHRVVVGNTSEEVNLEKKQRGRFNLTPLISKAMTTVVINPYWYPPPRLQAELLAELEKEPDFFEKHNYGMRMGPNGEEIIFQKSGGENALGLVKFLFPNEYDVYLHDTPKKALFERPIRAYSHGCMRVDKPLDLAGYILGRINGMTEDEIKKYLKKEKEHYVKLATPIPVFVEYNSVGADDQGRVHFYADVYKYDRAFWDGRLPVENTEDLTSGEVRALSGAALPASSGDEDDGVFPGE